MLLGTAQRCSARRTDCSASQLSTWAWEVVVEAKACEAVTFAGRAKIVHVLCAQCDAHLFGFRFLERLGEG